MGKIQDFLISLIVIINCVFWLKGVSFQWNWGAASVRGSIRQDNLVLSPELIVNISHWKELQTWHFEHYPFVICSNPWNSSLKISTVSILYIHLSWLSQIVLCFVMFVCCDCFSQVTAGPPARLKILDINHSEVLRILLILYILLLC